MPNDTHGTAPSPRNNSSPVKPWFIPALVGIIVVGLLLMYWATRIYGPSPAQPDADRAAQSDAEVNRIASMMAGAYQANKQGKFKEAMLLIDKVLAERPEIAQAHLLAGEIALGMNDLDRAKREFEAVELADEGNGQAAAYLTAVAVLKKDYPAARAMLKKAMAILQMQHDGKFAYGTLVLKAAANTDQPEAAIQAIQEALTVADSNTTVIKTAAIYGPQVLAHTGAALEETNPADAAVAYSEAVLAKRHASPSEVNSPDEWTTKAVDLFLQAGEPRAAARLLAVLTKGESQSTPYEPLAAQIRAALATQPATTTTAAEQ